MACFISDQESTKGKDPNINIVNGIHSIKGKTSVNILVSNYSNKHVTFNKGEYTGHLENIEEEENSYLTKIQMPIQQALLQQRKWCQNKLNQTLLNLHATNLNQTLRQSLRHFWRNAKHNSHEMKL